MTDCSKVIKLSIKRYLEYTLEIRYKQMGMPNRKTHGMKALTRQFPQANTRTVRLGEDGL